MSKPISDHIPCKIMVGTHIPKSKIFRFENYWADHPGFLETVQNSWASPRQTRSNSAATLALKLKNLRHSLKLWSQTLSNLNVLIEICNKVIFLDSLEECRPLFLMEWNLKNKNIYWKQRHTVNRIKFGDECTKYFHAMATISFRRNSIP